MDLNSLPPSILVTGGAGYIGSHTVLDLLSQGYRVVVLDSLENSLESQLDPLRSKITFYQGKIEDQSLVKRIMNDHSIQCVMHFAAFAYVGESVTNPIKYYRNNTGSAISLIESCIQNQVPNFIFSSTCATYGIPKKVPIIETTPQNPINSYGMSKLMIERVLKDSYQSHGLNSIIFRYFNAAGSNPKYHMGENHDPETHLIPLLIKAVLNPSFTFSVNGNDYETPDGTCIRDFVHVSDIANAHTLGVKKLLTSSPYFNEFNLGMGKGFSVMEVLKSVERISGLEVKHKFGERRPGDPPILIAKSNKVKKELGWKPKFKTIDSIVESAYQYHKMKKNL
jgi:UDP-glucose 4-epimerase